jgi:phytoene dehydrogenase-like protein
MRTTTTACDAVVIGSGHNALVTAAYLGKAGLRVLVLERREVIGGQAETRELDEGARVPRLAHTVGRIRPAVVRELGLRARGLSLAAPAVRVFAPQPDGRALVLRADPVETAAGLRAWSSADADRYADFDRLVRSLGGFMATLAASAPPDVAGPSLGDALAGLRLGRRFRGMGKLDGRTILRVLPMAVADFVGESLETDALRAAIAWRGVRYTSMGPWSAGSTAVLLAEAAGNDGGASGETVVAIGGPGALTNALADAARSAGVEIRTGSRVVAVTSRDGSVTGVALASGEEIEAPIVVGGVDPRHLLVDLADPVAVGPQLRWRAGNVRTPGVTAKVNLVLRGLPTFPAANGDESLLRGRILLAEGIDAIERAFDASKYGRISEAPILEAMIPSLLDPSLVDGAAAGTHVMSVVAQYAPRDLRDADWESEREAFGDRVLDRLELVAPGIGKLVRAREVVTPLDLEREYGLSGGHPLHAEPGLDSWYAWRPLLGFARYRMPLAGLYLCASGAHPGGGITGGPGQNAAREILADARSRRRR